MAAIHSAKMQAHLSSKRPAALVRPQRATRATVVPRAQLQPQKVAQAAAVALTAAASSLACAGNAFAASEVAQVAAGDSRFGAIALLFVPALGWVAFNAFQPLANQLNKMAEQSRQNIAVGTGLGVAASMLIAEHADAATEVAQVAAGDSRFGAIAILFVPALGWVAFNALQPLQNQLNKMAEQSRQSVAVGTGLGVAASMLIAEHADAATEVAQVAAGDSRFGAIALLFVPALGWVAFNALQPLQNQLNKMAEQNKQSIAVGTGLGLAASMLVAENADAATEVAQLAGGDSRVGAIALLFIPALGWVAFNALQPLLNQLEKMESSKRSIAVGAGLGAAASMLFAENASAVTEVAQLAATDNRVGIIASLFVPAIGWVAFNALQPLINQLDKMSGKD